MIDFTYGKDAFDQSGDGNYTDNRSVMLGDIFHSTPLVVGQPTIIHFFEPGYIAFRDDYNDRDRIVYAGANDGMLHAFHGGDFHGDDPGHGPCRRYYRRVVAGRTRACLRRGQAPPVAHERGRV